MFEIDARASDHREISEAQDVITWLKDQSSNTINYVISELQVELNERDSKYVKSMQKELNV